MKRQAESQHVAGAQEQQLLASIVVSGLHSPSLIDPKWQQNATNVKIGHPHAFAARASGHRPDSFDSIIRVAEEQGRRPIICYSLPLMGHVTPILSIAPGTRIVVLAW